MQPSAAYHAPYPPPPQQTGAYGDSAAYDDVQRYNAHFSSLRHQQQQQQSYAGGGNGTQPPGPYPASLSHSRSTPAALSAHFIGSSLTSSNASSASAQHAANLSSLPPLPPLPEFHPLLQQAFDLMGFRPSYQPRASSFSSLGSQQPAAPPASFDPYIPSSSYRQPPADPSRPLQHQPPLMSTQSQPPAQMSHRRRTAAADGYGAAAGNGAYTNHASRLSSHPYHRLPPSQASQRPVTAPYPPQQPQSSQQSRAISQPVATGGYIAPLQSYSPPPPPLMPEWEEGRLSGAVNRIKIDGGDYFSRDAAGAREQHQPYPPHHQQQPQQQQQRQRQHNIDLTQSPPPPPAPQPAANRPHPKHHPPPQPPQHPHFKSSPPNHQPAQSHPQSNQPQPNPPPLPPPANNPTSPRSSISAHELGDRYTLLDYLGSGSYGHVHLAQHRQGQYTVAIKKIIHIFDNLTNAKRLLREIKILRMLQHENVIHFYHLLPPSNINDFNDLSIVFEFVDTDLQKLIHSNQHFTNLHIQYFMYQLCCGIAYIHSAGVIHRDLKPANVLVNADCSLKICDFGLSRMGRESGAESSGAAGGVGGVNGAGGARGVDGSLGVPPPLRPKRGSTGASLSSSAITLPAPPSRMRRELTKHVVTRWYRAPELILLSEHYSTAIDMWSVGCILAELLSMQAESHTSPEDRQALFPGRSCFPLSADNPLAYNDQLDQLNVIFDVIGTPSPDDLQQVDNETARGYIGGLKPKPAVNLYSRYISADPLAVDLLSKLLVFNPAKRWTATRCLAHPFFDTVRDELCGLRYREGSGGQVDFRFEDKTLTRETIRALIVEELLVDNPQLVEQLKGRTKPEPGSMGMNGTVGMGGMAMGGMTAAAGGVAGGGYNNSVQQTAPPPIHTTSTSQQSRSRGPAPPPPQPSNPTHRLPSYSTQPPHAAPATSSSFYDAPPYPTPSLSHSRSSPSNLSHSLAPRASHAPPPALHGLAAELDLYPPQLDPLSSDMQQLQHAINQYAAQHKQAHDHIAALFQHDNVHTDPPPALDRRTAAGSSVRSGGGLYEQGRGSQYGQGSEYGGGYGGGGGVDGGQDSSYSYGMNGSNGVGGYASAGTSRNGNGVNQQQTYNMRQR